jgi:peroxiredoxin
MAETYLEGALVHTSGKLPQKGTTAPDWKLTRRDLSAVFSQIA